jgi:hypothetical protein
MSDPTPTRLETVTEHIEDVIEQRGDEAYSQIMAVCLKDISVSLAMLVDAGTTEGE